MRRTLKQFLRPLLPYRRCGFYGCLRKKMARSDSLTCWKHYLEMK